LLRSPLGWEVSIRSRRRRQGLEIGGILEGSLDLMRYIGDPSAACHLPRASDLDMTNSVECHDEPVSLREVLVELLPPDISEPGGDLNLLGCPAMLALEFGEALHEKVMFVAAGSEICEIVCGEDAGPHTGEPEQSLNNAHDCEDLFGTSITVMGTWCAVLCGAVVVDHVHDSADLPASMLGTLEYDNKELREEFALVDVRAPLTTLEGIEDFLLLWSEYHSEPLPIAKINAKERLARSIHKKIGNSLRSFAPWPRSSNLPGKRHFERETKKLPMRDGGEAQCQVKDPPKHTLGGLFWFTL
jgi:hypothetical protein